MNPDPFQPNKKNLVLIGGGHSHVAVIKQLGKNPLSGIKVTLVSESTYTPYSGMLPGLIAGHYHFDDCHIDLRKLCQWAGIRFICCTVKQLDLTEKKIFSSQYPPLNYNLSSINIGSQPRICTINGALEHAHSIKPINHFLSQWQQWLNSAKSTSKTYHITMVGGGAAGVEVILAMHYHINNASDIKADFTLICPDNSILSTHNKRVQLFFQRHFDRQNIKTILNQKVTAIAKHQLSLTNGQTLDTDFVTLAIDANAQSWPSESGLKCDQTGFIQVDKFLRSVSHPDIFAVGDSASFTPSQLPKAGVYAVRQGPILTKNLIATLKKSALQPFKPQRHFLSLLATGKQHAVASHGLLFATGKWVWHWKNYIDRKFMKRFNPTPMTVNNSDDSSQNNMRCGGCGAKINSSMLQNVLTQLNIQPNPGIVNGLGEDAAIINIPTGMHLVQSVDFFRQFIDDPHLLGRIAAIHSLGDLYAMGAKPHSALVTAVIPYNLPVIMEETLHHLMLGILLTLNKEKTTLIGGHSAEGNELAVGLTVNGTLAPNQELTKHGFNHEDNLILTKPIGTGVILAANMAARCQGRWLDNAIHYMLQSNKAAATILRNNGAGSCTDITGFGLLGHLQETLTLSQCGAILSLDNIPVLEGTLQCSALGIKSTLFSANKQSIKKLNYTGRHPVFPLLFDPQTAGGLLAGIPPRFTEQCLHDLSVAGYNTAKIGNINKQLPTNTIIYKE